MTRATILSLIAITIAGCGDEATKTTPDASMPDVAEADTVAVPDEITADTTFTAAKPYVLPKNTHVFVRNNATLTIEPGTEIRGDRGSVLVITRGAKILAEGTVDKPIVFTSAQPAGSKTVGFWGGLLILGKAKVNVNVKSNPSSNEALFEAFSNAEGEFGKFGGDVDTDNSGVLKYVRIEFGGFNFVADREFNNLTLCGVGSGTVIDFVQVHAGADDGIELFGGTVNVKHIVSSQNQDDGFDTDNGWNGKAQFVIVQNVSHPPGLPEASNGYESDNHGTTASYTAEPRTLPTMANVTLIGEHAYAPNRNLAAIFRRGTGGHYLNHIWSGFARGPEIRDVETEAQAIALNLTVTYSMFFGNDTSATQLPPDEAAPATNISEAAYLTTAGAIAAGRPDPHNLFTVDPGLPAAATSKTAPSFMPVAGAAALDPANAAPMTDQLLADAFFDKTATFLGAIGPVDWTVGWTKYPQN